MSFYYLIEISSEENLAEDERNSKIASFSQLLYESSQGPFRGFENAGGEQDHIGHSWVTHSNKNLSLFIDSSFKIPEEALMDFLLNRSEDVLIRVIIRTDSMVKFIELTNHEETDLSESLREINLTPVLWFSMHHINLIRVYSCIPPAREENHLSLRYIMSVPGFDHFFTWDEISADLDKKIEKFRSLGIKFSA